jgi:hypothetical protein
MRITDIRSAATEGQLRFEAMVEWEEAEREPLRWFVETDTVQGTGFWPNPNAWLLGAALPAWHAGEKRVEVDGLLCPVLVENLKVGLGVLREWFPELGPPPSIEATDGLRAYHPHGTEAVSLLSCGVDSMATLRWNRLHLPADHPRSITGVLSVDFVDHPGRDQPFSEKTRRRHRFVRRVAEDTGVDASLIRTNIWNLDNDGWFFTYKWHGAVFAAMAHFFSLRFHKTFLASSAYNSYSPSPWGSHPLLDTRYSSGEMETEHDGLHMLRYEKLALLAGWPGALENLLVCQGPEDAEGNCGRCEKCILTMTALLALGELGNAATFPADDVTTELLSTVIEYDMIDRLGSVRFLESLIPALSAQGRDDLVAVILRCRPFFTDKEETAGKKKRLLDG